MMKRGTKNHVTTTEVGEWLVKGLQVALYVRHAARPPILPDDPAFGLNLKLTDRGRSMAMALGHALHGKAESVTLWASPMTRTRQTALCIAEGAGFVDKGVADAVAISVDAILSDSIEAHRLMRQHGIRNFFLDYWHKGEATAAHDVARSAQGTLNWIKEASSGHLNLFASHDINLGTVLAYRDFTEEIAMNWIPYLTGMAMVKRDGLWEKHWFYDQQFFHGGDDV